jgi:hypothetical protein
MNDEQRIPDLFTEQDALGELPLHCDPDIRTRLEAEPQRAARLAELQVSNRQILADYPPEQMAREIRIRAEREVTQERRQMALRLAKVGVPAMILLALAVIFLAPMIFETGKPEEGLLPPEATRVKGPASLFLHRKVATGDEKLESGSPAKPGDLIQISYAAREANHGVIFSVDGRGQVSLHFPDNESGPTILKKKGMVSLDFSYELDDAPDFERFFIVSSKEPIDVRRVLKAAEDLGMEQEKKLSLPAGLQYKELLLKKKQDQ